MSFGSPAKDFGVRTTREATVNATRFLLLLSTLLVMLSARDLPGDSPGHSPARVAILLGAVGTAGVALTCNIAVDTVRWPRRAEWAVVIMLTLLGLISTAGLLAQTFAEMSSRRWLILTMTYTILGMGGTYLWVRRQPHLGWVFAVFLVAHTAFAVIFLRWAPANIDVAVFLHDGAVAALHGQNPYAMTFPNIYESPATETFYGPGVVIDGRVTYGFPYLPVSLLVAIPGQLLGDVRYSQLIAMLLTAVVLRLLATDPVGRSAAILGIAAPAAIPVLAGAWTEPALVALLACLVLALERRRTLLAAAFLGLFFVSKQYVVIALPLIWLVRQWLTPRVIVTAAGLASAVTLPFFLVDPPAFWKAIVEFQLIQPFRADSLSLLVASVNAFGWPPPWTYGVLPLAAGGLTALVLACRAPRTPPAFAASVGLTLLVTILLSKQAFMNYYFVVSGAFLIAAVAWPTLPLSPDLQHRRKP